MANLFLYLFIYFLFCRSQALFGILFFFAFLWATALMVDYFLVYFHFSVLFCFYLQAHLFVPIEVCSLVLSLSLSLLLFQCGVCLLRIFLVYALSFLAMTKKKTTFFYFGARAQPCWCLVMQHGTLYASNRAQIQYQYAYKLHRLPFFHYPAV